MSNNALIRDTERGPLRTVLEPEMCCRCDGTGIVFTGIAEASAVVCNKCEGKGTEEVK